MTSYRVVGNVGGVLLTLTSHYAIRQPWARAKLRKEVSCAVSGITIPKGATAWRPMDNGMNRFHRISESGMQRLLAK